jgi:FG-GAP-like repeat
MQFWRMKYLLIGLTVLAACGADTRRGGFAGETIRVGKGAGSVETADFNKDGYPDIVVANEEDSSVTILLNDGKGLFRPAEGSPFFANHNPNDICVADVNKDGYPDLGIADTEVSMLTLLLGNGKGQFVQAPTSPYPVHSKPHTHGLAIADFNRDGRLDLATDDWGHNQVLIVFGDSALRFGGETFYEVGNRPYQRLRSGDVNGDRKADLVTTNQEGNNVTVLLGNGDGRFREAAGSPFASGSAPFGVAIGDVNGDGLADLAVVDAPTITSESKGKDGLWILLGDGTGAFRTMPGSPYVAGKSPSRVAIGDIDGDGINDIAVTNYNDKSITVFYMGKSGVLRSETIGVGGRPDGICIKDFNGDGRGDIAVGNAGDGTVTVLMRR